VTVGRKVGKFIAICVIGRSMGHVFGWLHARSGGYPVVADDLAFPVAGLAAGIIAWKLLGRWVTVARICRDKPTDEDGESEAQSDADQHDSDRDHTAAD